jgi:mannose-1-phosphate guanylyltransferase
MDKAYLKYLKYKTKYLKLKNKRDEYGTQIGGAVELESAKFSPIKDRTYIVLFAGGSGTRLLPLSTEGIENIRKSDDDDGNEPKQFLQLFKSDVHISGGSAASGDVREGIESFFEECLDQSNKKHSLVGYRSLLQSSYDKFKLLNVDDDHFIVATRDNWIKKAQDNLPGTKVIGEPVGRDTGPAHILSARYVEQVHGSKSGKPIIINVYVDNFIPPGDDTIKYLNAQINAALACDHFEKFVAVGIKPSFPNENFGHIVHTGVVGEHGSIPITEFKEKPKGAVLDDLMARGALWNAGQYVTRADVFLRLAQEHDSVLFAKSTFENYKSIQPSEKKPVDKMISEKAARNNQMLCIVGDFTWFDVGTWPAVHEVISKYFTDNTLNTNAILHGTPIPIPPKTGGDLEKIPPSKGNIIRNNGKPIIVNGVSDLAIIDTDNFLYIGPKDASGALKEIASNDTIKNNVPGRPTYIH